MAKRNLLDSRAESLCILGGLLMPCACLGASWLTRSDIGLLSEEAPFLRLSPPCLTHVLLSSAVETPRESMSGLALFLIVFFSLVAVVFAIVIGIIVYNKWQEQSRKHFY